MAKNITDNRKPNKDKQRYSSHSDSSMIPGGRQGRWTEKPSCVLSCYHPPTDCSVLKNLEINKSENKGNVAMTWWDATKELPIVSFFLKMYDMCQAV